MCSSEQGRLAAIGQAINEVAEELRAGAAHSGMTGELAGRLARIWALIAELDPALGDRVRYYTDDSGQGTGPPTR